MRRVTPDRVLTVMEDLPGGPDWRPLEPTDELAAREPEP